MRAFSRRACLQPSAWTGAHHLRRRGAARSAPGL